MIYGALYVCKKCGMEFEKPLRTYEGGYEEEPFYVCPHCYSDNFVAADTCAKCGHTFPADELLSGYCQDCLDDYAHEYARDFVMNDPDERELFAWWLERRNREER